MTHTTLAQAVMETDGMLPYDAACKRILSEREILARIMKDCLTEYAGCTVEEIATRYIKDDPLVGVAPLRPVAPRVTGTRNDEALPVEGRVTYDIRFTAEAPGVTGTIGLLVNVEAQGAADRSRRLANRAIYYCARMLSAQYGEIFTRSHYEDMRKVYSIWICPNPPKGQENTVSRYSICREDIVGSIDEDPAAYDLLSIVMVRLGAPGSSGYTGSVLDLLGQLFSKEVSSADKLRMLERDYGIALTDELEGGVVLMGSFGEHIYLEAREAGLRDGRAEGIEQGIAEGIEQGIEQGIAQGIEQGIAQGIEQGIAQGTMNAMTAALANLMASTGWDINRAFDALAIAQDERPGYRERLGA